MRYILRTAIDETIELCEDARLRRFPSPLGGEGSADVASRCQSGIRGGGDVRIHFCEKNPLSLAVRVIITPMSEVTRILEAIGGGDTRALERLLPLVYDELRQLAAAKLSHEAPGQTLQATALVHEAYLRLIGGAEPRFQTRGHFFTAAAEAMRRILIDRARSRGRQKRGGGARRLELGELDLASPPPDDDLLALDEALSKLETEDLVGSPGTELEFAL